MPSPKEPAACRALLVGIDGYAQRPLTSAVNDLDRVHATLVELGLVAEANVVRLASPTPSGGLAPTRRNIGKALYEIYEHGENIERFFFFFAGHGIMAFSGAMRSRPRTVLMPVDAEDIDADGSLLLDFDEILERMRFRGPKEQFYFIDACRDLPYARYPDVGTLGWSEQPRLSERAQAALFAVAPLGRAKAARQGLGVMTEHLVDALQGHGEALDFDDELQAHVVTMRSVRNHVWSAVRRTLASEPLWQQRYSEPQLQASEPGPGPLRLVSSVPDAALTIHFEPEDAPELTRVNLLLRGQPLSDLSFPPRSNHAVVVLRPLRYLLRVSPPLSYMAVPEQVVVDARTQREVTFRVVDKMVELKALMSIEGSPSPGSRPEPRLYDPERFVRVSFDRDDPPGDEDEWRIRRSALFLDLLDHDPPSQNSSETTQRPTTGTVWATAFEPETTIELSSLEPPYRTWSSVQALRYAVPLGSYRVRFRLGSSVFYTEDVFVAPGDDLQVSASATSGASQLLREALPFARAALETIDISEGIGPMQAAVLPTLLSLLGVAPFDRTDMLLRNGRRLVTSRDPADFEHRVLSLVVAVDGDGWTAPVLEVLHSLSCRVLERGVPESEQVEFQSLARAALVGSSSGLGLKRAKLSLTAAPKRPFLIELRSPHTPSIRFASAAFGGYVTIAVLVLRPDGTFDLNQCLVAIPGTTPNQGVAPGAPVVPSARWVRDHLCAQMLYRSGELGTRARKLSDLPFVNWADPIVSAMSYFSLRDGFTPRNGREAAVFSALLQKQVNDNLAAFSGAIPDSRLVAGLAGGDMRRIFTDMLDEGDIPLLAESTRALARYAEQHHRSDASVVDLARRIPAGQIWTLTIDDPAAQERAI